MKNGDNIVASIDLMVNMSCEKNSVKLLCLYIMGSHDRS